MDWKKLASIHDIRNEAEHYFSNLPNQTIQETLSKSGILIHDLFVNYLDDNPLNALGQEAWNYLLKEAEMYDVERKKCVDALLSVNWESPALATALDEYSCESCGSNLLIPLDIAVPKEKIVLMCKACGNESDFEEFVKDALHDAFSWRDHHSVKDGGEPNLIACPFCFEETYIIDEGKCANCGESAQHRCQLCGCGIPAHEISEGEFCGYCQYKMDKDD